MASDDDDIKFCVDGHEFRSRESCLLGDGQFPPFYVFNVEDQEYLPGGYKTREEAQRVCDYLIVLEKRRRAHGNR